MHWIGLNWERVWQISSGGAGCWAGRGEWVRSGHGGLSYGGGYPSFLFLTAGPPGGPGGTRHVCLTPECVEAGGFDVSEGCSPKKIIRGHRGGTNPREPRVLCPNL